MIGEALDKVVGVFSPEAQLKRMAGREAINQLQKRQQYAAAKVSLSSGPWAPADPKINTLLANSLANLRSRSRQLVRDMPAMATGLDRAVDFTIGTGLTLQSVITRPGEKTLNTALNQQIEDAWKYFCDQADHGEKLHLDEIAQLNCRQEIEVGEYVCIERVERKKGKYLPFSLMLLEPDDLKKFGGSSLLGGNVNGALASGNNIHEGVEYKPLSGAPVAYHFENYDRWQSTIRIPKENVVIGFKTLRPQQLRGVTPLAPIIMLAHSMRDFIEAEVSSAQRAARWLAFVTSQNPQATMDAFGVAASSDYQDTAGNAKYTMEFGNAIVDFLNTGEQVTLANHNRPGDAFYPFIQFLLQTFASSIGISYELISGNYEYSKYTQARTARNDMTKITKIRRKRMVMKFYEPVRKRFMQWAVMSGKLNIPDYFQNPEAYQRVLWIDDGMESIDPLREGRADTDAVTNRLKSPQEILIARGKDPETHLDEIARWEEMLKDRNLDPVVATKQIGLQTNPAQVGAAENNSTVAGK